MAQLLQKILGGQASSAVPPAAPADDVFADFAGVPDPSPASRFPDAAASSFSTTASASPVAAIPTGGFQARPRPFTKWYRVWERVYIEDFYAELFILPFVLLLVVLHLWGSRKNKRKAKAWQATYGPVLQKEFSSVGFSGQPTSLSDEDLTGGGDLKLNEDAIKAKSSNEFIAYATGRQNVAFVDIKITMSKRYNPFQAYAEMALGFLFESMPAPVERTEATSFVFDGREAALVPSLLKSGTEGQEKSRSGFDGFVWAVVHKERMKGLRDGRYDLSLTTTRDSDKLPDWASIMSESAEITDTLLTPELIKAVESAGEALEAFVVSDQPIDQPKTLNEAQPKKRVSLALRLPSGSSPKDFEPTLPLFSYFLRMPDILVEKAHFRPEAMRRVKTTREEEMKKIRKADETEKSEERRTKQEKEKKRERDEKMRGMSSEQQKKFLEKERMQEMRKGQRARTVKA